jgi:glycosyltransferase involved in cell wall biosynthesis
MDQPRSASSAAGPLDVTVLKSWDFGSSTGGRGQAPLPYRMDYLEEQGFVLHWTDAVHRPSWQRSRAYAPLRRLESLTFPFVQTALNLPAIRTSPVVLAMFESEANALAAARRASPRRPSSTMAVVTCWLAHILSTSSSARRRAYRWAYSSVDRIYYLSQNQGPVLAEQLDARPEQLAFVPFGVDQETFAPAGPPDDDDGYVLVVGRDRGRDWTTTFDALRNVPSPVKVCARPSDLRGCAVPANVETLGYVDRDVYRTLLGRARVVVVSTRPVLYPSGQSVLLEAMSMGRAVVVTDTPALSGYIQDGLTALAVPPGDASALRDRIRDAFGDDALRRRLGAGGRAAVERNYSAKMMWATIAKDLRTLVAVRSR